MNELAAMTPPAFKNKVLREATRKVLKIGVTVRRCAYETAYIMAQVEESECFKEDGFNTVHEWAMKTFGFKKSASYTLLRVGKEYTRAIPDANARIVGYGSNLLPATADCDFTTTQIEKLLPAGHDLAATLAASGEVTPAMTCKEIEKVVKAHTKPEIVIEPEKPEAEPEKPEVEPKKKKCRKKEPAEAEPEKQEAEPEKQEEEPVKHMVRVVDAAGIYYEIPFEILVQYKI